MDEVGIFLDSYEHNVTDMNCESEENIMAGQMHSEVLSDVGKRVHEEDPSNEENSISNNKKICRSIANENDKKTESAASSDGVEIDDNACPHCLKRFDGQRKKRKHMTQVHKVFSRTNSAIKCNECNIRFGLTKLLRKHLEEVHDCRMTVEEYSFPNMEAFKVWKLNLERKEAVYFSQHAGQRIKDLGTRYNYVCNRSGIYKPQITKPESRRRIRYRGSCKIGSYCTAAISCFKSKDDVKVKYWPEHYGHMKDIPSELPSGKDQSTLEAENITSDALFDDLLKDVRSQLTSESILPSATRKKDKQILKEAFESIQYNSGMSDSESVDHWVRLCLQMEDSPVLCYRQEELGDGEEFLLVIMTEFQKQLLMTSEKKVICVDSVHRRKGGRFYLTCISIVDEWDIAFPVAFCISNQVDSNVVKQFLMSVKKSTGPLSCTYFMSDSEQFYFDAWKEVMEDNSKWLWSMWHMDYNVTIKLRNYFIKSSYDRKAEIYRTIKTLIECQSQIIFETTFKKFLDSLLVDQLAPVKKFGNVVLSKYSPNVEKWAYCYRTDIKSSTSFQLDALHRTLRLCCKEGRKTRLDKFIFVLMKYVKRKMLDRLMNILDDEKIKMVRETINMCHKAGLNISPQHISSLSDKIWLIKSEDEESVYVMRDFDSCPEHCTMQCAECDICVHMYSCSCIPSMLNANLCQHIHAVVWKFLTPHHFSPMPSPALDNNTDSDNNDTSTARNNCPELMKSVLNMAHEIYKSVRKNRRTFSKEELTLIKWRLSETKECIDMCSKKKVSLNTEGVVQQVSIPPNLNLPPNAQNNVFQPLILQAFQNPNIKDNSSETTGANQAQQFVIYVPHSKPSGSEK